MSFTAPISGPIRAGRRTKDLVKRLRPGDIAFIHHQDLDATAAASLVERRPSAVVNAVASISGRYPNRGPSVLMDSGIPLIDSVGEALFEDALSREGKIARVEEDVVRLDSGGCAVGKRQTSESVARQMEVARQNLVNELDGFARNTLEYIAEEKGLLLDPIDIPDLKTPIAGRHALVVVRGEGYKEDLRMIGAYLSDIQPVLIAVDGGADALLEMGLKPDIIVGDMDSVSDRALRCGAELLVHGYARGDREAPGMERVHALGLTAQVFHSPGTSEDIAMLIADELGATLIAAVGTHFSLEEFLDKGRRGMASTFLVRLRIGAKLVDAKGIARLYGQRHRWAARDVFIIFLAAAAPVAVIILSSPYLQMLLRTLRLSIRSTFGI
jgi:uncharacterized membrane-anchored protein